MSRTTYLQDMNGAVREYASFNEAFDFMLAANRIDGTWTIVPKPVAVEPKAPAEPVNMDGWEAGRRFAGSYERQSAWNAEYAKRAAALSSSLDEIAARRDIVQFLDAAE